MEAEDTRLTRLVAAVLRWLEFCNDRDNSSRVVVIALAVAVQTSSIKIQIKKLCPTNFAIW